MAKRNPVNRLEVGGISTAVTARPVDTYVRPAETQAQQSPLSQFVEAIAPVVKAKANKELEIKLKREREIESFRLQQKDQQVKHQVINRFSEIAKDYLNKPEQYHEQSTAAIVSSIDKDIFDHTERMTAAGEDPLLVDKFKWLSENAKVKFIADFSAGKRTYEINKQKEGIKKAFLSQESLFKGTGKEQVDAIVSLVNENAYTNLTENKKGKKVPNWNMVNEILVSAANDKAASNPNNSLYLAAEKLGLLTNPKYSKTMNTLKGKRDSHLLKVNTGNSVLALVQQANDTGTLVNKTYKGVNGKAVGASKQQLEQAIFKSTVNGKPFTELNLKEQADQYRITGILPEIVTNGVKNILTNMTTGTNDSIDTNRAIKNGFKQYQVLKASGINPESYMSPEEAKKFEAFELLLEREGKQGQFIVPAPDFESDFVFDMSYEDADYNSTATEMQKYKKSNEPEITEAFSKKIKGELDPIFGDSIRDLPSSLLIFNEVVSDVRYFMALGASEKEALKRATATATKNYPIIEAGGASRQYGFSHLALNVPMGLDAKKTIGQMNKALAANVNLQDYLLDAKGLIVGTYSVLVDSDPVNPTQVGIRVISEEGVSISILGKFDKVAILSDPQILYRVVAKNLEDINAAPLENKLDAIISYDFDADTALTYNSFGKEVNYQKRGTQFYRVKEDGTLAKEPATGLVKANLNRGIESDLVTFTNPSEVVVDTSLETDSAETGTSPTKGVMERLMKRDEGGIVSSSPNSEKQSSFLDVINPISTANASTLDGTEEAFVPSNQPTTGENVTMEGNTIAEKTASLISTQEGFKASPYADGKDKSVGYGFYLPSLEPDEKALIKDINNVTIEEGKAVLGLKIQKISNFLNDKIENFTNLPEKAQMAVTSMGYQLGVTNIPRVWKKFTAAITEAAQYAEGSAEQAQALGKAQFEMLYNVSKDGTISLNKWATQTKKRAFEMAEAVGDTTVEYANEASSSILDIIFPKAEASTIKVQGTYKTNEEPNADTVTAIAKSRNPALETMKYVGISEGNSEGAQAIMKLWEGVTGNWQKKGESVADFVSNNSWCALFVTQVLRDSGIDTSKFGKSKWDLVRAKTYQTVGESIYNGKAAEGQPRGSFNNVKAGDILVKEHTPEERKMYKLGFGHAGIVAKVEGDEVYFIAGNSSDQVKMSSYNIKEKANNLTIRRVKGTKDIPADSVPSYLEVKVKGDYTKFKNSMTSLYKWAIN